MQVGVSGASREYVPGSRVSVLASHLTVSSARTVGADGDNDGDRIVRLTFEIIQAFVPFTMAVVCRVRPLSIECPNGNGNGSDRSSTLPAECVLKLFDRRGVPNLRAEFDEGRAYDRNRETAYKNYLLDIDKPCHDFDSYPFWLHEDEEDEGVFEAYIAHQCETMWTKEVQAYKRMEDLQGHSIPRLLGVVKYSPPGDQLDINGVLLEYVPSTTLRGYITTKLQRGPIDRDEISSVCQEAVDLVKTVRENGVLNKDVRLDNILVRTKVAFPRSIPDPPATATPSSFLKRFISYLPTLPTRLFRHNSPLPALRPSPCLAIDFASCRLRYEDETDEEWRRAKQSQDEEGAIGSVLEWLLKECSKGVAQGGSAGGSGGGTGPVLDGSGVWTYTPSWRWDRKLTKDEQAAYEADSSWGLYKRHERVRDLDHDSATTVS